MRYKSANQFLTGVVVVTVTAGCTGATIRSGVGEQRLEEPPYYGGTHAFDGGAIAHLPITFQRGATDSEMFDPKSTEGTPVHALLTEMNAYLDSLAITSPLGPVTLEGTPPDIQSGCGSLTTSVDSCEESEDYRLRLAVARPSRSWIQSLRDVATNANARRVLVINLETGNYWPNQKNLRGQKNVLLGTGYALDIPWLTSLDKPVSVLQLTGALMDTTGLAVRIGAEGLMAKRTNIVLSGLGAQALITDEDVEQIRAARRDDLSGSPLVWKVALRNLVAQLTGRMELVVRE
jgi:hypothetical protein